MEAELLLAELLATRWAADAAPHKRDRVQNRKSQLTLPKMVRPSLM